MARKTAKTPPPPIVGVVMGSQSDWEIMQNAAKTLSDFGVPFEVGIVSAHRTPERLVAYGTSAASRGLKTIIAGAGGAAHLPGMLAALTTVPVLGVPVPSKALDGLDSLLSIAQMPAGIPVGTLAIGKAGATNAALLAVSILGLSDEKLAEKFAKWRAKQTAKVAKRPGKVRIPIVPATYSNHYPATVPTVIRSQNRS
ncbi:MAG: 5-(carboxyamino)imidazole ribonucleotide mutase [Alphaproteobacteria bacterium]|nr:5-(carboxyamino)imidazole ribonucleotide mutase [Alphaproteobacteria bacterium]